MKTKSISLLFVLTTLSGCLSFPSSSSNSEEGLLSKFDDIVDSFSCSASVHVTKQLFLNAKNLNETKEDCINIYESPENVQLRLLRAQVIAAVVTRYGISRINDFSTDKEADLIRLKSKLRKTLEDLSKGLTLIKSTELDRDLYPVKKADLYLDFVDLSISAARPVLKEAQYLILATPTQRLNDGGKLLANVLKDALYQEAYIASLKNLRASTVASNKIDDSQFPKAWKAVNDHLLEQCDTLNSLEKTSTIDCKL